MAHRRIGCSQGHARYLELSAKRQIEVESAMKKGLWGGESKSLTEKEFAKRKKKRKIAKKNRKRK